MDRRLPADLELAVEQIKRYVPIIAPYYADPTPLGEYSAGLRHRPRHQVHAHRQEQLARAARRVATATFGADAPVVEAADLTAVNIVDHHQLLNHPLLLGTNVIANAARLLHGDVTRPIVTFSCSNVPPSNYYLRNGFQFRGRRVAYFSHSEYRDVIYHAPSRTFDFVSRLRRGGRLAEFTPADRDFLVHYEEILNKLGPGDRDRHRDQIAMALRATWPMLFRQPVPELLYLNAEEVTRNLLIELLAGDNHIAAALLDPVLRDDVLDTFRGVVVAWDEATGTGTHFFWRRHPDHRQLLRMYVDGDRLVPHDPRFAELSVPLRRQALVDHLRCDDLVPAVSLQVSMFLYTGIRPLVGPGSLVYFRRFAHGWAGLLNRHGLDEEAALVADVDTGGLIAGTPLFFDRADDGLRTLYATDVLGNGGVDTTYLRTVLSAPLRDVLTVGAGGVYDLFANSYIPPDERLDVRVGFDDAATAVHRWI
ncbi:hypothetical protein ABT336_21380 [Micromonospora sp. NPDC000207]|uniref:hypothetical protein n=1 Tax=Micromonospora sp. NPDC000207 TaxID=3154246 RepID=UPI003328B8DE